MAAVAPTGDSVFADAIKQGRWPELDPATMEEIAAFHRRWGGALHDAADKSHSDYRPQLGELLVGQAGDAQLYSHDLNVNGWLRHAAAHRDAGRTAGDVADYLRGLRSDLTAIIDAGEPDFHAALKQGDRRGAQTILASYQNQADAAVNHAVQRIKLVTHSEFTSAPSDADTDGAQPDPQHSTDDSHQQPPAKADADHQDLKKKQDGSETTDPNHPSTTDPNHPSTTDPNHPLSNDPDHPGTDDPSSSTPSVGDPQDPAPTTTQDPHVASAQPVAAPVPAHSPVMPMVPPVAAAGSTVSSAPGNGGGSALGSPRNISSDPGVVIPSAPPAPTVPSHSSVPVSPAPSFVTAGDLEHGLGSGVASGMGAAAALPLAATQPWQFDGSHAPPAGVTPPATSGWLGGPSTGTGPAITSSGAAGSVFGSDGAGGPVGLGGPGGAMMPAPPVKAPLAPYSPPGAGMLTSNGPTAPAPPSPALPAPAGATSGGGVAPLIASHSGASTTAAVSAKGVNPDFIAAQRILGGLVASCPDRPIFWAVSVLRTPVGPQTLIANSVGGGGYLPPGVSLPSTLGLAVLDPTLPFDWAAAWMGWQSPLAILVDHYERLTKIVAGVTVSAMVTSELWPGRPDCGGDFMAIRHEEIAQSGASPLVGRHRLAVTDPALAARLTALDRGGDVSSWVAAQLTRAIWAGGSQPDATGSPIAVEADANILGLVAEGAAQREHWDDYQRDVQCRAGGAVLMPEIHAPRDADDAPSSVNARMWYRHFYAMGRIAEMVQCWAHQPVSIPDIAYCGVAADFGSLITAVLTEIEKQLAEVGRTDGGKL